MPDVIAFPAPEAPPAAPEDLRRLVASRVAALETEGPFEVLPRRLALEPAQRRELAERLELLAGWMRPVGELPGGAAFVLGAVRALYYAKPEGRRMNDQQLSEMLVIYLEDLADLPAFAVAAACRKTRRSTAKDMPSVGALRAAAFEASAAIAVEQRNMRRVLEAKLAPVPDPERLTRIQAIIRKVRQALRMFPDQGKPSGAGEAAPAAPATWAETEARLLSRAADPPLASEALQGLLSDGKVGARTA